MKKVLLFAALVAMAFGFAGVAKADTSAGGVVYSFTNSGSDGSGGFLVTMTVNTTGATASGTFVSFAVQFTGATSVSLQSVSASAGGLGNWSAMIQGNNGGGSCSASNANFWCSNATSGLTVTANSQNNGTYTFVFDVTGVGSAPTETHIQTFQGQGALAISNDDGINPPTSTPEPASMLLLGLGLAGAPFLRRRRS